MSDYLNLLCLPIEVLEKIFKDRSLTFLDVANLGKTCCLFRQVSCNKSVWEAKFKQRWPELYRRYSVRPMNWDEEIQACLTHSTTIRQKVAAMSAQFWHVEHISRDNLLPFVHLLDRSQHPLAMFFYLEALLELVHGGSRNFRKPTHLTLNIGDNQDSQESQEEKALRNKNLTEKYYAYRVLKMLHHKHLTERWNEFLALPAQEQHIEAGAILIAQWCQPHILISEKTIYKFMDQMQVCVEQRLNGTKEGQDSDKKISCNDESSAKTNLSKKPSRQEILEALNHVMFIQLQIRGNNTEYYNPKNSYLDKVVQRRTGIPITMCILYMAVARRLGVVLEAINFPCHFIIRFQPQDGVPVYTYVDVFNGGKFMSEMECLRMPNLPERLIHNEEIFRPVPPTKVYERMVQNLINVFRQSDNQRGENIDQLVSVLELGLCISAGDPDYSMLLVRLYVHLRINLLGIDDIIDRAIERDPSRAGMFSYFRDMARAESEAVRSEERPEKVVKARSNTKNIVVLFGVGMVMKHRKYHYNCVIYGWDWRCEASQHWIMQMGVNNLHYGPAQPFYNVLVEDGSQRYAAQENLMIPEEFVQVSHHEVGRYFEEFCGKYYRPNREKAEEYPEDWAFIQHDAYLPQSIRDRGLRVMRLDGHGRAPPKS